MESLKQISNIFASCLLGYFLLFILIHAFPEAISKYGLLNNKLNLISYVQSKALKVSTDMKEVNLGLNFIGNFHQLSSLERNAFQNSGLLHLLAISGAQILPVASLFCFISSSLLFYFFKNKLRPHKLMLFNSKLNSFIGFGLSLFIALLYGGSGALIRVSFLNFFRNLKLFHFWQKLIFIQCPNLLLPFIDKFIILFLISLLFGNIFVNYSFILSAIGASCAEISAYFSQVVIGYKKNNVLNKFTSSKFFLEIFITILTCVFVGVILSPLTNTSIVSSCMANIFAIPIITFLVTPCALLVLVTPENVSVFDWFLKALDYSLMLFKHVAFVFGRLEQDQASFSLFNRLFTQESLFYLNVVMIVLWVCVDFKRERKLFMMRLNFIKAFA